MQETDGLWLATIVLRERGQTYDQFVDDNAWLQDDVRADTYAGKDFDGTGDTLSKRYPEGKMYLARIGSFSASSVAPDFEALCKFAEMYLGVPVAKYADFDVVEEGNKVFLTGADMEKRVVVKHREGRSDSHQVIGST
jgi:hypothetical protein